MKKADVGVALYLLCAVIFFIVPIPFVGLHVGNQYFHSVDCIV